MILSVGEILVDMMGNSDTYTMHVGGAPFNVAVGAKRAGAQVGFVGKVGDDVPGKFILKNLDQFGLDKTVIKVDGLRNTTLAFVAHDDNGERDFAFFRHDTADYQLSLEDVDFDLFKDVKILHVGTLMLSEAVGRDFATALIGKAKSKGVVISIDANFRDDIYESKSARNDIFKPYLKSADVLKLGLDELLDYTGAPTLDEGVKVLDHKGVLFITDGGNGSHVYAGGSHAFIPSTKVTPIDTTGAGDAFFGTALQGIDNLLASNTPLTVDALIPVTQKANLAGAEATQKLGAI